MTTATISVEEYLSTTYHPDCDYVDGVVEERNLGQKDHNKLQRSLLYWFGRHGPSLGLDAFQEQRIRIREGRYRVPDVCVVHLPEPDEQVFTAPPYIVIELLSPEDTLARYQERFGDYLDMGVPYIWVIDPASRHAWEATRQGPLEVTDGVLRTRDGLVILPVDELFSSTNRP
jgi:Uma2 family endonuclease